MKFFRLTFSFVTWITLSVSGAATSTDIPEICDQSARTAARETDVPVKVLLAITRVETGRTQNNVLRPWPWTVNMEGKGVWFADRQKALEYTRTHFQNGARSFDVGCFQINYRWHHTAFSSLENMFDPYANAIYAANFLKSLYQETGNWSEAAGAYHSRTPSFARKYTARFEQVLANVEIPKAQPAIKTTKVRLNNFPLLQGQTQPSALGSLMPTQSNAATPFWKG